MVRHFELRRSANVGHCWLCLLSPMVWEWWKMSDNCWNFGDISLHSRNTMHFRFKVRHLETHGRLTWGIVGQSRQCHHWFGHCRKCRYSRWNIDDISFRSWETFYFRFIATLKSIGFTSLFGSSRLIDWLIFWITVVADAGECRLPHQLFWRGREYMGSRWNFDNILLRSWETFYFRFIVRHFEVRWWIDIGQCRLCHQWFGHSRECEGSIWNFDDILFRSLVTYYFRSVVRHFEIWWTADIGQCR